MSQIPPDQKFEDAKKALMDSIDKVITVAQARVKNQNLWQNFHRKDMAELIGRLTGIKVEMQEFIP